MGDKPIKEEQIEQSAVETKESQKQEKGEKEAKKTGIEVLAEYKETLQRLQAEFENYRKRTDKENAVLRQFATIDIINKLLPLMDSFELALGKADKKDEIVKGFELIYSQLFSVLEKEGLRKIAGKGKQFDPHLHEALLQEDHDGEPNIVLEELQKGYMLHSRVLRPARVKISKKSNGD